jgi:hypothetical protein
MCCLAGLSQFCRGCWEGRGGEGRRGDGTGRGEGTVKATVSSLPGSDAITPTSSPHLKRCDIPKCGDSLRKSGSIRTDSDGEGSPLFIQRAVDALERVVNRHIRLDHLHTYVGHAVSKSWTCCPIVGEIGADSSLGGTDQTFPTCLKWCRLSSNISLSTYLDLPSRETALLPNLESASAPGRKSRASTAAHARMLAH